MNRNPDYKTIHFISTRKITALWAAFSSSCRGGGNNGAFWPQFWFFSGEKKFLDAIFFGKKLVLVENISCGKLVLVDKISCGKKILAGNNVVES